MTSEEKELISVIIPIYNAERYLNRTISSVLHQSYHNLEIWLIDDGSTDNSSRICEEYQKKDRRVNYRKQDNGGVASARNLGLTLATGSYLFFLDSDDWVDTNYFFELINSLKSRYAEVVITSYTREFGSRHLKNPLFGTKKFSIKKGKIRQKVLRRLIGPWGGDLVHPLRLDDLSPVWGKLYLSSVAKKIRFRTITEIGSEDLLFNVEFFSMISSMTYMESVSYHYFKDNEDSLVHSYRPYLLDAWLNLDEVLNVLIKQKGLSEIFQEARVNRLAVNSLNLCRNVVQSNLPVTKKIKELNFIVNNEKIIEALGKLPTNLMPLQWRIFYLIIKKKMTLLIYVFVRFGEVLKRMIK
ncbi:glycosyltransferase family 2 protein [Lacticaseibacillus paracasei]|uniref:glycosyltransferase family 2 protein n=1 Tax=Lacticaseibacillus paracasei TaxID=1597 RepID=UPI002B233027|nr:glycosyltransferase family 2 protein [Lacticaseibacillus paracasei]MEB0329409.1 glycosyltransferase family 2 protein [Lacticaseibacillus paracasei]